MLRSLSLAQSLLKDQKMPIRRLREPTLMKMYGTDWLETTKNVENNFLNRKVIQLIYNHIQTHNKYLGPPYSSCRREYKLDYYANYTEAHCIYECVSKAILQKCDCVTNYLAISPNSAYRKCTLYGTSQ